MSDEDWYKSIPKQNFTIQKCQNISRARAFIEHQEISAYVQDMATAFQGIPSENVLNFVETNSSHDLSYKKSFSSGAKYPESLIHRELNYNTNENWMV